jgi:DNA-binding NarL/FixJ family response regulator
MTRAGSVRVAVAAQPSVVRSSLRRLVATQPDFEVAGEADSERELRVMLRRQRIDVLLLDLDVPGVRGMAIVDSLRRTHPRLSVLALTFDDDSPRAALALAAGVDQWLSAQATPAELFEAIRAAARGERIAPPVALKPASRLRGEPLAVLSARELQTLKLLVRGLTNRDVATHLNVSVKTAETYRSRLALKLGLRGRVQIVEYALQAGLLGTGESEA